MFWGLSDSLDLYNEYLNIFKKQNEDTEQNLENIDASNEENSNLMKTDINILLFGSNDPRHVIKTMAKLFTHKSQAFKPKLNFYLVEGCVEVVARNLLLLAIALEKLDVVNLRSKVNLFMDIYGNSLIRASSQHYLMAKTKSLLKMVTDSEYLKILSPMLNLEGMKYRELDGLENAFKFWMSNEKHNFDMKSNWNIRLRNDMGMRFDYREGQFDWDLNMVLKEREGKQICSQEYRYWRETGIAFTFPEYEYSKSNRTLAAGLIRNGDKFAHRGFIGDIRSGPFFTFGIKTSDERMLASNHGENDYRATDITERNLLELFHELETQTSYEHDARVSHKYGAVRLKMSNCLAHHEDDVQRAKEYDKPWISMNGVSINFLSSDDILTLQQNHAGKWSRFFDVAFVGHNYFSFLQDSFVNNLNPCSILIMETKQLSTARKEEVTKFEETLLNYAKRNNLKDAVNYKTLNCKNLFLKFKLLD